MQRKVRLAEVYDRYFAELFYMVIELVRDEEKTQDIIALTFIALYRILEKEIKGDNNVRAFLWTTSRNMSLDYLKKKYNDTVNS